jgi:hypothetical protein
MKLLRNAKYATLDNDKRRVEARGRLRPMVRVKNAVAR